MHAPPTARVLCTILALCAVTGSRAAAATTAPAWMRAQVGVPEPAHDEKTSALLLYSETTVTIQPNGTIKRLERTVYKILRPDGEGYGVHRVDIDSRIRITDMHGWCIPVEGKDYEVKMKESVESAVLGVDGGELVSDVRTKLLRVPAAVPGALVGFEVQMEQKPYIFADEWEFQDVLPLREAHYTLQLPPGWTYRTTWINHAAASPTAVAAGQWHWIIQDVEAVKPERDMPPWRGIAAKMIVALEPPDGRSKAFQTWQEMGTWYQALAEGRRDLSPEIRQKAVELTAQLPTPLARMQALASFVQKDIRYVAIELGIGGMQPHPATEVFANRFGDCKDKVTLLGAMLKEIGIESYYS